MGNESGGRKKFKAASEFDSYNWVSPEAKDEMKAKQIQLGRQELRTWSGPLLGEFKEYEYLSSETGEGGSYYEIIQTARNESVDIIVMGTHGRTGLNHLIFGSTAENVVKKIALPATNRAASQKTKYVVGHRGLL